MRIESICKAQKRFFAEGRTREIEFRLRQLDRLRKALKEREGELLEALKADLNKPAFEGYAAEIGMVYEEIRCWKKNLREWAKPQKAATSIMNMPGNSLVYQEPLGVVLIMSPWNYPVLLTLDPLVGALGAGNCAVVKPSAYAPKTSRVLREMLEELFPPYYVAVVEGGREENQSLLNQPFDFLFFTGSEKVGRMAMKAAAEHLTPVCLELGGKSPCIVDETADLDLAARRIVWGKYLNAGQTCVAPDYLLVQESVREPLLKRMKYYIGKFYGEDGQIPADFPRIVNERHFQRLLGLLSSGKLYTGGESSQEELKIAPTILDGVSWESPIMAEEIFGPILPVLTFHELSEVIEKVGKRPRPLACYYFTKDQQREKQVILSLPFGGGCINDTIMHLASTAMPFGGVGSSGMGGYHGKDSFDLFSHKKSILKKSCLVDVPLRYPPYKEMSLKLVKKFLK